MTTITQQEIEEKSRFDSREVPSDPVTAMQLIAEVCVQLCLQVMPSTLMFGLEGPLMDLVTQEEYDSEKFPPHKIALQCISVHCVSEEREPLMIWFNGPHSGERFVVNGYATYTYATCAELRLVIHEAIVDLRMSKTARLRKFKLNGRSNRSKDTPEDKLQEEWSRTAKQQDSENEEKAFQDAENEAYQKTLGR
jgi:hypothetical protein